MRTQLPPLRPKERKRKGKDVNSINNVQLKAIKEIFIQCHPERSRRMALLYLTATLRQAQCDNTSYTVSYLELNKSKEK